MDKETNHQVAAFIAAKEKGDITNMAYSVYDMGELLITRCASIPKTTEHRALLIAAWSAVSWCKGNIPELPLSVYSLDLRVVNELTAVWINKKECSDFEDSDRIKSVLRDCIFIKQVAFGICPMEGAVFADYTRRMNELVDLVNYDRGTEKAV